jgi:hypothetical protein
MALQSTPLQLTVGQGQYQAACLAAEKQNKLRKKKLFQDF